METRDQWYKPNLLYNIHWRPPKKQEAPDMIVKTVRFNPSVCTCGEHSCGPHYRMERKVVWINKETTNTENKKGTSDSLRRLPSDQENKTKESEDLRSKEENISYTYCKNESNGKNRCIESKADDTAITKEGFHGDDCMRLDTGDTRKDGKNKDSADLEVFKGVRDEIGGGKKLKCAKDEEGSFDGSKTSNSDVNVDVERNGKLGSLKGKAHRRNGENKFGDNYDDNPGTDESRKRGDDEYLIKTPESDEESRSRDFQERTVNDDGDSASFSGEFKRIENKLVLFDKCGCEKIGEDLKSGCDFSVEDNVRNGVIGNSSTDNEERCNVNSTDFSDGGCDREVTEEIYEDKEISPSFGIMSIYCSSEIHSVLRPPARFTDEYKGI